MYRLFQCGVSDGVQCCRLKHGSFELVGGKGEVAKRVRNVGQRGQDVYSCA